jgi:hypothetical protein
MAIYLGGYLSGRWRPQARGVRRIAALRRREGSLDNGRLKDDRPGYDPRVAMIYILAIFLPPLALLLNGQPFSALLNLIILVPCIVLGVLLFPITSIVLLIPSIHAVIAIAMRREDRKHREIVEAIERHGPPPGRGR